MAKSDVVIIKLDRNRVLRYGHKALKTLMALTGKDLDASMDMETLDLVELEKILYCGLLSDAKSQNENLKLEDMEDLLDQAESFVYITKKLEEAFQASFGTTDSPNPKA
jgi:hypothetical protein